jgi:hypothetical protein
LYILFLLIEKVPVEKRKEEVYWHNCPLSRMNLKNFSLRFGVTMAGFVLGKKESPAASRGFWFFNALL